MRYEFVLPRSFQPAEILPLRLLPRADDARWLVSLIVRKTASKDVDPWGCVRLHSDILRRVMYEPTYPAVVKALEDGGAIETAPYHAGIKCKGYRLAKRYLGDRCVRMPATDPRLIERIESDQKRRDDQHPEWKPVHYMLNDEQKAVSVTTDADPILETLPEHARLCQDVLVSNIRHRQFPFSVSSTGRVFNAITGLKRNIRPALRLDGEPMGSVDIRCAQPALLALLLSQENHTNGLLRLRTSKHTLPGGSACLAPSDALNFAALALAGLLYDRLIESTGLDRNTVKLRFLVDVLAKDVSKRGDYPSLVESAFRAAYPSVHKTIRQINRDDHGTLIRVLQRAESWLVVETVAPRLLGKLPMLTLHDAIYSSRREVGRVVDTFRAVFRELGCEMGLNVEG